MSEDLNTDVKVLTERVNNWMDTTTDYRKQLCRKIDEINARLLTLPCPSRIEETKGIKFQLKALWGFIVMIIAAIIGEWIHKR